MAKKAKKPPKKPPKKPLLILVEGATDEAFFKRAVVPKLRGRYGEVKVVPYAQTPPKIVCGLLSVYEKSGGEYVLVRDRDSHVHGCMTKCKDFCVRKYQGLDPKRIRVVEEAIESWLIAVADGKLRAARKWTHADTSQLGKKEFRQLLEQGEGEYALAQEILKNPDIVSGRNRNPSLEYFFARLP